jgi:hypothetical protein
LSEKITTYFFGPFEPSTDYEAARYEVLTVDGDGWDQLIHSATHIEQLDEGMLVIMGDQLYEMTGERHSSSWRVQQVNLDLPVITFFRMLS